MTSRSAATADVPATTIAKPSEMSLRARILDITAAGLRNGPGKLPPDYVRRHQVRLVLLSIMNFIGRGRLDRHQTWSPPDIMG